MIESQFENFSAVDVWCCMPTDNQKKQSKERKFHEVGARLRTLIQENGYTQAQFAKVMGYKSGSTISKQVSGENMPEGENLRLMAQKLHTSPDYILYGDKKEKTEASVYQKNAESLAPIKTETAEGERMADQEMIKKLFTQIEIANQQNAQLNQQFNARIDRMLEREDKYRAKEELLQAEIDQLKKEILELKLALESSKKNPSNYNKKASNGDTLGE